MHAAVADAVEKNPKVPAPAVEKKTREPREKNDKKGTTKNT